ncbi:hypothetical protein GCM10009530_06650 [Microbispora corallina]|uniref:SnoaL-like domain-containing protein n=1 Tax=Microbispora corallina TaxID=83302 RepID=A0ABQ4FV70_9ACTN|nr:hypothetical protein [Microbispora corallina]GIH38628.1 hypothetical protein Mco01_16280 [Microbispora corallina]
MIDIDAGNLVGRYVALWGEPDAGVRRTTIEELWAEGGGHVLQPPQEIRETAAGLGFDHTTLEVHGYDAIEARVAHAYRTFVAPGEYTFRSAGDVVRLREMVKFTWEMVPVGGGDPVGGGLEVLVLGEDGRIVTDYQFPGP